jgi:hypothetical protein
MPVPPPARVIAAVEGAAVVAAALFPPQQTAPCALGFSPGGFSSDNARRFRSTYQKNIGQLPSKLNFFCGSGFPAAMLEAESLSTINKPFCQ